MSLKKIISSAAAAAVAASMLTIGPAVNAADTEIWNYGFEGSDIGGSITGYNESIIMEDPSDASNHVYNLGTSQITKNVNDTVFTGKYRISFDFECVSYDAGQCAFYAYVYRNGADYKSADYLSLTANGALQFNGTNVLQANGTSLYYLKGGRYHVDWVIDKAQKHQTVTLTGLINSKEGQTITVADADFEDRNSVGFEYTSGLQLKGGNLYIDNIIAAPYTSPDEQPTPGVPTQEVPTQPAVTSAPTEPGSIWSYDFERTYSDTEFGTNYSNDNISDGVYNLGTSPIAKYYDFNNGKYKISLDFTCASYYDNVTNPGGDSTFIMRLYRNAGKNYRSADMLSLTNKGALQFNGANVLQANGTSLYYLKGGTYHIDWMFDTAAKTQTVEVTGLINSKEGVTVTVVRDEPIGVINNEEYEYTSGIQLVGGSLYIDNITARQELEGPITGFRELDAVTVTGDTISGFINGYPVSALDPVWRDGNSGSAVVKNVYGETVTDGGIYDGYTYEVTSSDGGVFSYTFEAVTDTYSNNFNSEVSLSDGSSEITSANVGQRDKMFPAQDAVYTETDAKPTNSGGDKVNGWNQGLFQSVVVGEAGLALNREAAPYKSDKAVALKTTEYAGEKNIQVIKDFYADDEDYPVQISMSIMPDGNGDVSFGIKTSYYGEPWKANIDATDGSGLNSIATPIAFMADKTIMCFGANSGFTYEPGNWYNASLVLDKVTENGVTTKKAYAYLNGEKLGEYDWSTIAAQIAGNEGFYSLTMRENYKTAANAVTSKTFFDNLQISKLYSTDALPNGYMFRPVSDNAAVTINNFGGAIEVTGGADAADSITVPAGVTVTEQDGRLVLSAGDYVQTYTIKAAKPIVTVENNTARVENSKNGVLIVAVYDSDHTLANVYTADITGGTGELTFESGQGQSIKVMGWSSLAEQKPVFDAAEF